MATGYVICTTPRSGSTLLCTLLEATKRAGNPDSFYHEPHLMLEWAVAWGLPVANTLPPMKYDAAYLEAAISEGRGATPVFGMRLQHYYLATLTATLAGLYPDARSDAERFTCAFGSLRYVHLTRRDKVAQAVSLVKAQQSGLWHRNADGSERERSAPASIPIYDSEEIHREVAKLTEADEAWNQWFTNEQINPLRIVYEIFAPEPAPTIRNICTLIGVDPPDTETIRPSVASLADGLNIDWVARYRADRGHIEEFSQDR